MNLYTVIAEFDGGTLISQVEAKDHGEALNIWGRHRIRSLKPGTRAAITRIIRDGKHRLEPLENLRNAWGLCSSDGGEFILISVVGTETAQERIRE